jgi:hypothetical protein
VKSFNRQPPEIRWFAFTISPKTLLESASAFISDIRYSSSPKMPRLTELLKYVLGIGCYKYAATHGAGQDFPAGWRFFSRATQFKKEVKQTVMTAWEKSRGNHFHPR